MSKKSLPLKPDRDTVEQVEQEIWKGLNDSVRLARVARLLEFHQQQAANDRSHIYEALIDCAHEGIPLPSWLQKEILAIHDAVLDRNGNLHDLFGLKSKYPAKGKRAQSARSRLKSQIKLYVLARPLIENGESKEKAIKATRELHKIPYGQRKSREMFDAQERVTNGYLDALKGVKRNLSK